MSENLNHLNPIRAGELVKVKRGVALLDRVKPKWFTKFKAQQFDLSDGNRCALGQVYGDYIEGLRELASTGLAQMLKTSGLKLHEGHELAVINSSGHVVDNPELDGPYYGFEVNDSDGTGSSQSAIYERMGGAWLYFAAQRSKKAARARKRQAALNG